MKFFQASHAMVTASPQATLSNHLQLQVTDPEQGNYLLDLSFLRGQEVQECQER